MRKDSALFIMTESNRIEFKRELTKELDIEREVVAFLNYREGGIIYIGIDDSGQAVGVQDIDGICSELRIEFVMAYRLLLWDYLMLLLSRLITSLLSKSLSQVVQRNHIIKPMTPEQIANLYQQRIHNSIHNIPSPRQDLTFNQLRIYYEEKGMHLNDQYLRTLELSQMMEYSIMLPIY